MSAEAPADDPMRCPTCGGRGKVKNDYQAQPHTNSADMTCPTCHGTGRRDVVVVEAELLRRIARAYYLAEPDRSDRHTDAEWEQIESWAGGA